MSADKWRRKAEDLEAQVDQLVADGRVDLALPLAARAAGYRELAAGLERGLTVTNQPRTVKGMVGAAAKEQDWRKPPSLREVAKMLGCTQGFLSQARAGLTRIRLSWAERIAAVRPDLPATKKTWPKGWAPEQG